MVYSPNEYDIFIGIDVDQKSFSFTGKNHDTFRKSAWVTFNVSQFGNTFYLDKALFSSIL